MQIIIKMYINNKINVDSKGIKAELDEGTTDMFANKNTFFC